MDRALFEGGDVDAISHSAAVAATADGDGLMRKRHGKAKYIRFNGFNEKGKRLKWLTP